MVTKMKWLPYLLTLPALFLALAFVIIPTARSVYVSFFEWNGIGEATYVGFENYKELIMDKVFWSSLWHTVLYAILVVSVSVVLGFLLAVAIDRRIRGWSTYKVIFFIPMMMALTIISVLWIKLLEPNAGIFNTVLRQIGLGDFAKSWLADPNYSIFVIAAVGVWVSTGAMMIMFLASLSTIDPAIHEAATLDGAKEFKRIIYITLPIIKRPFLTITMLQIIGAFKTFDLFWLMTGGGPGRASEVLSTMLYREISNYREYGMACAISVMMLIIIGTISLVYIKKAKLGKQVIE